MFRRIAVRLPLALAATLAAIHSPVRADDAPATKPDRIPPVVDLSTIVPDAKKGFEILVSVPMSGGVMKKADLDRIWQVWEPEERTKAEAASPEERRRMTFERYGFVERDFDDSGVPYGFTDDGAGNLATNCFSCHAGKVEGKPMPGVENSHIDMTTMAEDMQKLQRLDRGLDPEGGRPLPMPFGIVANYSKGFTNATQFSPLLGAMRDEHLDLIGMRSPGKVVNNDMIPPAWWHFKKKEKIYSDAFAPKTHRTLMQFAMSPSNSGETLRGYEPHFVHIKAFIESMEPPKYPHSVDAKLAAEGRELFEQTCAKCHGTYGENPSYPNKVVPIGEIGTDRKRFEAVSRDGRAHYNKSWFSDYGDHPVDLDSVGYIAPPLDGVWATAPYFHNGSSPTIWHVLNPSARPKVWKRDENGYDRERVGLNVEEFAAVPEGLSPRLARMYYDTATPSHDAGGHTYPDELDDAEKRAVLEYLKTL